MLIIKEDTALVGVAELRTKVPEVLKEIKKHKVVLTKRNLPVGVIMDYSEYEKMQGILETQSWSISDNIQDRKN